MTVLRTVSYALVAVVIVKTAKKLSSYLYWRTTNNKPMKLIQKEPINEVLFFPDSEYPCTVISRSLLVNNKINQARTPNQKTCRNPSCFRLHGREEEPPSSMLKFVTYLASARSRVDLCIYMFTQSQLFEILKHLHLNGVLVRIITDGSEDDAIGTQVARLQDLGIQVRSNKRGTGALMHHKFVVIDNEILLSGSFNWTNKAVVSNYEAVIVTSSETFVQPFIQKFNEMWLMFDPHRSKKFNIYH